MRRLRVSLVALVATKPKHLAARNFVIVVT
jgi:hypothetical protein